MQWDDGILNKVCELPPSSLQIGLKLLAIADVAGNLGCCDNPPLRVVDRRHRGRDVDAASFFGDADSLKMIHALAGTHQAENRFFFSQFFRRDEVGD